MLESNFQRVVLTLLSDLGGDVADSVASAIRSENVAGLSAIRVDPSHYEDPEVFFRDYQAAELLRKIELPASVASLEAAAEVVFFECEAQCYLTNLRLNPFVHRVYDDEAQMAMSEFFSISKKFIHDTLGPLPHILDLKFGKGSTYSDRGFLTTIPDKMTSQPTITADAEDLLPLVRDTAWFRALYSRGNSVSTPERVRGNRFTTVPKDTTKRRGICIEPSVNISLQLAVGQVMKTCLKRAGLDLLNGQDLHRDLARIGSRDGTYATIDLSNASDTVSFNLVKLLLPTMWFDLLCSLRSSWTNVRGKWHRLEKFSSMGNGFTFELETIIFASLLHACGGNIGVDSFVYGDDIITPPDVAKRLLSVLEFVGFTANKRKTFLDGHFRESCGGDFFKGIAVRPHYIKEEPNEPQDWIKLANGIRRVGFTSSRSVLRWYRLRRAWLRCLDNIPAHIRRLRGPSELGDQVIHDDIILRRWRPNGIGYVKVYRPITRPLSWAHWHPDVQLASALYGVPSEGPIPRDNVSGYKVGWVAFS